MIESFASGLGTKVADRWAALLLSPACVFWALGVVGWLWTRPDSAGRLIERLATLSGLAQGLLVAAALGVVAASGLVVERIAPMVLRLLQGYWFHPLRQFFAARFRRRLSDDEDRWQRLYARSEAGDAGAAEHAELLAVERRLANLPGRPEQVMATRLGNTLRAAESRPYDWYGLDAVRCWPRLWLVLPDTVKTEVTNAGTELNSAAAWWTWGALTAVWTVFTPWFLLVAPVACMLSYSLLLGTASRFGLLVDATFDVHRGLLYDALGWNRPTDPKDERERGLALTEMLWRGTV